MSTHFDSANMFAVYGLPRFRAGWARDPADAPTGSAQNRLVDRSGGTVHALNIYLYIANHCIIGP